MDRRLLREFADRHRAEVAADRRRYRQEQFVRRGAEASVTLSTALWQHMRAVRADWPTEREREADLEAHVALKRTLDRVAHAFTARRSPA